MIHKDRNKRKLNIKVDCDCGGKYSLHNKSHHIKTKKHSNYISTNANASVHAISI